MSLAGRYFPLLAPHLSIVGSVSGHLKLNSSHNSFLIASSAIDLKAGSPRFEISVLSWFFMPWARRQKDEAFSEDRAEKFVREVGESVF